VRALLQRENVTCYHAWHVAVAEALGAPLATLDARLAKAPGPRLKATAPDWLVAPQYDLGSPSECWAT